MKNFFFILLIAASILQAQQITVKGIVTDSQTFRPLAGANITLKENSSIGTTSQTDGKFTLSGITLNSILKISYIGYVSKYFTITSSTANKQVSITLEHQIISSQTVLIEGNISKEGITPLAFNKIKRKEIEENYTLQDIPEYLSSLPSTTYYSENGNGIGYNYLSIRGFDQRRISVSINGIPQNDPEDHNVYWLDFPNLLASTEVIQVQRGSGSGVTGYPAVGGSINIITSSFSNKSKQELSASIGSYNTRKYSSSFSSGLIDNKYSVYAGLSKTLSSGYRNGAWIKFNSYHISAVRYDKNITTQINFYGGPIEDGLAYTGLPKFAITDRTLRKENYSYWESDGKNYTFKVERRPTEIENFSQPHFELLNEFKLSDDITLNSALFLVTGSGFFDFDGSWADTTYLRLTNSNGFNSTGNPQNTLIHAQVENKQFGFIPRLKINHRNGETIIGGEFRHHRSEHWGSIDFAENLPAGVTKNYSYYFYRGGNDILNGFIHEAYQFSDKLNFLGELQLAYQRYKIYDERYIGNDFSLSNLFLNPRLGINYKINHLQNMFLSFARVSREPRLVNYYNAGESSGGEVPQFEQNADGSYNFERPLVHPETMNDLEFGTSVYGDNYTITLNLFYMVFDNEIVKNGKVDIFGQPVTGNIPVTVHKGIEFSGSFLPANGVTIFANATYSKNKINEGNYFIDANNSINLSGNNISGFPEFLANIGLKYENEHVYFQLKGKYVGKFYSDNYSDNLNNYLTKFPGFVGYSDNINDAYFNTDIFAAFKVRIFDSLDDSKIFLQVNNLFDKLYSANAIGGEFFPAAERNFLVGLKIGL